MFNLADYLESILPAVPELKKIYKFSDISKIEELLGDIRNNPESAILVKETGDGFLNLKDRSLDSGYHNFYVMVKPSGSSSEARHNAKKQAMQIGVKMFKRMKEDSLDFGDPTYGMDFSKIDYMGWGPIGLDYHGYSYFFLIEQSV